MDDEDDQESYFNARKDLPLIPYPEDEDEIEYDSDGNPIPPEKSKVGSVVYFVPHFNVPLFTPRKASLLILLILPQIPMIKIYHVMFHF